MNEFLVPPGPDSNTGQAQEAIDGRQPSLDFQGLRGVAFDRRGQAN